MDFAQTLTNGVTILQPKGRIDTVSSRNFENKITTLLDTEGCKKLVIDLSQVEYISSAGLRIFLIAGKKLKGGGGNVVLCHMAPQISEVFRVSGFDKILTIVSNVDEAVSKFS